MNDYFYKALEIIKKNYGNEHPYVATCYKNTAHVYMEMKEYNKALVCYKKAYEIRKKILGQEHASTREIEVIIERIGKEINQTE